MSTAGRKSAAPSRAAPDDKYASLANGARNGAPEFSSTDGSTLAAAMDRVVADGDAIMFSRTADGGAICVLILSGDRKLKRYCAHQEELDQLLTYLDSL